MDENVSRLQFISKTFSELKEPSYRLDQIKHAIYQEKALKYSEISSLPKNLQLRLEHDLGNILFITPLVVNRGSDSIKVLFQTRDNHMIESVWMKNEPDLEGRVHESLCVSSQSGCPLKCKFCYTGTMGFQKDLTVDEICDQVLYFRKTQGFQGSVSFMGMGEPFLNQDHVFEALHNLIDSKLFGIGQRKINVSTVGIIPGIQRLSDEFPEINLAFSLHTPFNEQRLELMPITKTYPIDQVMQVLDEHIIKNKRKVFIAYIMINNINDSNRHALALAPLIKKRPKISYLYHVNLIKYHGRKEELGFSTSSSIKIKEFMKVLESEGINYTLRKSFGLDINGACGQLCAE